MLTTQKIVDIYLIFTYDFFVCINVDVILIGSIEYITNLFIVDTIRLMNYLELSSVIMIVRHYLFVTIMIRDIVEGWKWVTYFSLGSLAWWRLTRSLCGSSRQRIWASTWVHLYTKLHMNKQVINYTSKNIENYRIIKFIFVTLNYEI